MAQRKFIIDGGFKTDDASELLANLTMGGTIDMDSNRILNVGTPSASTDATTKNYVDVQLYSKDVILSLDVTGLTDPNDIGTADGPKNSIASI